VRYFLFSVRYLAPHCLQVVKQTKAAIKRHNIKHCVKMSGTKAALQSKITAKNIKVIGSTHSASKRKSAPVASATGMTKKQARVNKTAAARAKALGLGGYGARKGHFYAMLIYFEQANLLFSLLQA